MNTTDDQDHSSHSESTQSDNQITGHEATYFHTQNAFHLIFKSAYIDDDKSLVSACIVLFLVAFFQEGLKLSRAKLLIKTRPKQFLNKTCGQRMFSGWHLLQTLLHAIQVFLVLFCCLVQFI